MPSRLAYHCTSDSPCIGPAGTALRSVLPRPTAAPALADMLPPMLKCHPSHSGTIASRGGQHCRGGLGKDPHLCGGGVGNVSDARPVGTGPALPCGQGALALLSGNTRPSAGAWRYRTVDDGAQQRRTAHNLDPIVRRRKRAGLTAGSVGARVLPEGSHHGSKRTEEAAPANAGTASDLRSSQSGRRDLNPRPLDPSRASIPCHGSHGVVPGRTVPRTIVARSSEHRGESSGPG